MVEHLGPLLNKWVRWRAMEHLGPLLIVFTLGSLAKAASTPNTWSVCSRK